MTNLYIQNEHCLNIEQLKTYFQDLSEDTEAYFDLLDYSRHGDLARWLYEHGRLELVREVEDIDAKLGDADYMNRLTEIFIPHENSISHFKKPPFDKCADLIVSHKYISDDTLLVELALNILLPANEKYEIKLNTGWGSKGFTINLSEFDESSTYQASFLFHKRLGKNFEELRILIDGIPIILETVPKLPNKISRPYLPCVSKEDAIAKYLIANLIYQIADSLPVLILNIKDRKQCKCMLNERHTINK